MLILPPPVQTRLDMFTLHASHGMQVLDCAYIIVQYKEVSDLRRCVPARIFYLLRT